MTTAKKDRLYAIAERIKNECHAAGVGFIPSSFEFIGALNELCAEFEPEKLYPPTRTILETFSASFVKFEAHDFYDPESSDLLWLEYTPENELSDGEVICVSPLGDSWYVSRESAFKVGGWATNWDIAGTVDEVFEIFLIMLKRDKPC